MAANLMRNGYQLTIFNRSKKYVDEFSSVGAVVAQNPKEVAKNSDVVIDMVTDAPDVEQVLLGKNGVIEGAKKGLVVIDMSTNSPDFARSVSSKLAKNRVEFLDAPVTGGDKGARTATLTIMVGGKKSVFQKCKPILQSMGKEIVYMGDSGSGQATKLCNQVAVSIHTLATCEALLLGASSGLDLNDVLKVLTAGAAGSWNLSNLGPKIIQRDFEPGFKGRTPLEGFALHHAAFRDKPGLASRKLVGVSAPQLHPCRKQGGERYASACDRSGESLFSRDQMIPTQSLKQCGKEVN